MKNEIHYSDMSETELCFIIDALKYRITELKAESKRLRGKLARVNVMRYMGEVQHAK